MTKKLLFAALIALFLGFSNLQAQNEKNSENSGKENIEFKNKKFNVPKHAVSVQMPLNSRKIGIGARYAYQFTDILRFTVDTDWYYYTFPKGRVNTITRDLSTISTANWGRQFDLNANVNLVFGDGNFNFYLIVGFYTSVGHSRIDKFIVDMFGAINGDGDVDYDDGIDNIYYDDEGEAYIYTDRIDQFYTYGIGVNAGFGVELQTSERSRFFIEQQAAIGLMMVWMPKLGWSYCF
jgi:hypothetical protein